MPDDVLGSGRLTLSRPFAAQLVELRTERCCGLRNDRGETGPFGLLRVSLAARRPHARVPRRSPNRRDTYGLPPHLQNRPDVLGNKGAAKKL